MSRRKRYSTEFKREVLKRANEEGVTDVLVAEELGILDQLLEMYIYYFSLRQDVLPIGSDFTIQAVNISDDCGSIALL